MIGIDTNVFVRFLVDDDNRSQHKAARQFMAARSAEDPARISMVVLAETIWLLRRRLRYTQGKITLAMRQLLAASDLVFEEHDYLTALFNADEAPEADIADHLIAWSNQKAGCADTMTFDTQAASLVPGMKFLT